MAFFEVLEKVMKAVGSVEEVRMDARSLAAQRTIKVRPKIDLQELMVGPLANYQGKKVYVDF